MGRETHRYAADLIDNRDYTIGCPPQSLGRQVSPPSLQNRAVNLSLLGESPGTGEHMIRTVTMLLSRPLSIPLIYSRETTLFHQRSGCAYRPVQQPLTVNTIPNSLNYLVNQVKSFCRSLVLITWPRSVNWELPPN